MACLIARPDPQTLFNQYRDRFSADVLGGSPVVPESNEWYVTSLNYAMAEEFYAISEQQWKERDPRYACCDNLFDLAAKDGIYPRDAASAQGYVILTGVAGSVMPASFEVSANGQNYVSVSMLPPQMPTSGTMIVRVQAVTPGLAGNAAGTAPNGTLTTPIAGVEADVVVCGGTFCGGREAEECEAFRLRYLQRKQYHPRATQAWSIQKLQEWPCVTRALPRGGNCCNCDSEVEGYNCSSCGTAVDFYVMMDNSFACGVPPADALLEIQEWFFGVNQGRGEGQVEIGVCGSIVRPNPFYIDVNIDIVACPSASQIASIQQQVQDFFTTVVPSVDVLTRQVSMIASQIVGPLVDVQARFDFVDQADVGVRASYSDCGDLLVTCDSLPCLRNVTLTGPGITTGGSC